MKIYLLTAALCVVVALILAITLPQLGLVGKKPQETVPPSPTPSVSEGSPTISETPTPSSPESETPTPSDPGPAIPKIPVTMADLTATNPLLIVNAEHPFNPAKALNIVNMYNVKDTSHGVNRLQFAGSTAPLNEEAFLALQELQFVMGDAHEGYCLFTKTCQITVGENMVDCDCSEKTLDDATKSPHSTGYVVDLRLYKKTDGNTSYSYFQSPGVQDVASTVLKNCAKFGWIQSWSATNLAANGKTANDQGEFRYVGVPHALYIMEKGLTFDGYMEAVRQTNYMKPLQVIDAESQTVYKIYFVSLEDATNPAKGVPVPAGSDYKIQGNGVDGFIVTLTQTPEPTPTPTPEPTPTPSGNMHVTTVYVDAGHGFTNSWGDFDRGAGEDSEYYRISLEETGIGLYEADMNLKIALRVKELLLEKGYRVIMSREDYVNRYLPINNRAAMAADSEADLLVSIHGNTASKASAFGARVYYSDRRGDSRNYANAVAAAIDQNGASRKITTVHLDNGLAMVNSVGMPSVLVETCFLTNTEDAEQALTEEWINSMAKSIVDGICKEFPCETTFQ